MVYTKKLKPAQKVLQSCVFRIISISSSPIGIATNVAVAIDAAQTLTFLVRSIFM
jgi:hypothetical protein